MAGEIAVDLRQIEWESGRRPGISRKMLRGDREGEYTAFLRLDPGVKGPPRNNRTTFARPVPSVSIGRNGPVVW